MTATTPSGTTSSRSAASPSASSAAAASATGKILRLARISPPPVNNTGGNPAGSTGGGTKATAGRARNDSRPAASRSAANGRSAANRDVRQPQPKEAPAPTPVRPSSDSTDTIWVTYKRTHDENLRNILIERHLPLVRYIAERLLQTLPKSIELDDLTSAGTFGLMDAIDGFDLTRGIKFKTYCTTRIRGSILDELRSQDWVPRLVRLKAHRLERAYRTLEGRLGREPNAFELSREMGVTIEELAAVQSEASPKTVFSLSERWDENEDDNEMEKVEVIEDKKGPDPVQSLHQKDLLEMITRNLTKKERLIIIMYYYEGLTMREIGDIMELTESRVCQIHSNVMSRLKAQLEVEKARLLA